MNYLHKTKRYSLLIVIFAGFMLQVLAQGNMVSYAYDMAGNRISRKIVLIGSNPAHAKAEEPIPMEETMGERKITIYPNPTKGALAVTISGGNDKPVSAGGDEIRIILYSAQGTQLQNHIAQWGTTAINMKTYPVGWYILRVQAGEKRTEFKIIKQ